jgi:2-polyprenyl-3-methyl-5-hydroxy-6-metoxy-1,4-benzoquinol methylase
MSDVPVEALESLESVDSCDLCGSVERRAVRRWIDPLGTTSQRFTLVACQGCGVHYIDPRPTRAEIHRYYPSDYANHLEDGPPKVTRWLRQASEAPSASTLWRLLLKVRQDIARRFVPPLHGERRLLDVGCGAGGFLDTMRLLGWSTHGVEPSPAAVEIARAKGHDVTVGVAESLADHAGPFDTITMSHVLEHTHSPTEALAQAHARLAPGGQLVLAVPNYMSLHRLLFGNAWCGAEPPRHLYQLDKRALERYLTRAGFTDVRIWSRTGSGSYLRGLRQTVNRLLGTNWRCEPRFMSLPFEVPSALGALVGFFGLGSDLRATAVRAG